MASFRSLLFLCCAPALSACAPDSEHELGTSMATVATFRFTNGAVGEFLTDLNHGGVGYLESGEIGESWPYFGNQIPSSMLEAYLQLAPADADVPAALVDAEGLADEDPRLSGRRVVDEVVEPVLVENPEARSAAWYCGAPNEKQAFLAAGGCSLPPGTSHHSVCRADANSVGLAWNTSNREITFSITATCTSAYPSWTDHRSGSNLTSIFSYYTYHNQWKAAAYTEDYQKKLRGAEIQIPSTSYYRGFIDNYNR